MLLPMVCGSPNWDYSGRKAFKDFFIFRRTNTDFFLRIINKLILKQTNKRNNQSPAANFNTDGDVPPRGAVHAQKSWPHCSSGRKDRRSCRIHTMGAEQEWPSSLLAASWAWSTPGHSETCAASATCVLLLLCQRGGTYVQTQSHKTLIVCQGPQC